jgi:hypothetical protein
LLEIADMSKYLEIKKKTYFSSAMKILKSLKN